jgi:hypothetical protein
MSISPFGGWWMVFSQLYFTISREEIFYFGNKKMLYLCGFWRFANAYKIDKKEEKLKSSYPALFSIREKNLVRPWLERPNHRF